MSMVTYPLNQIEYTAEDAELYLCTRESGVYDGNDFSIEIVNNEVTVEPGIAWIRNRRFSGKVVALKEAKRLTLSVPNSAYNRIDAVVIQFDANTNKTDIVIKEGIASSNPIAPDVVRTESIYELHTFHIFRRPGSTSIGSDDITDLRDNYDYCGIMFDPISSIDNTLSVAGKAADSKAVGMALNGKAPAGYGLGTVQPIEWGNIDNITANGWYSAIVNGEIAPSASTYMAWIRVDALGANYACQTAYITSGDHILQRHLHGGVWSEWEWVNPPMLPGVEYRTTERNDGKAVYAARVSVGTMVANAEVQIPIKAGNTLNILRFSGQLGNHALPITSYGAWIDVKPVNASTMQIRMHTDEPALVGSPVYVSIWYTKD